MECIIAEHKRFSEGRDYWYQYVRLNGYSFGPNTEGLKELSRNIDINIPHIKKCLNVFLNS